MFIVYIYNDNMFHCDTSLNPEDADLARSVKDLPASIFTLLECPKPPRPRHPTFGLFTEDVIPIILSSEDYAWLLVKVQYKTIQYMSLIYYTIRVSKLIYIG